MHRHNSAAARFSNRVLMTHACAGLPQTLDLRPRASANDPAEIMIYDEIGLWGVTAKDFVATLKQAGPGDITVRINSPGGDVFDGLAIYAALQNHDGVVTCVVDGLAASAASFIALAGASVTMNENAFIMIHNAWGFAMGNRHDMAETSAVLAKIDHQLASIYAGKTGKSVDEMAALMDAETWFTAQEAQDAGFVSAVETGKKAVKASLRSGIFNHTPPQIAASSTDTSLADGLMARRRLLKLMEAED